MLQPALQGPCVASSLGWWGSGFPPGGRHFADCMKVSQVCRSPLEKTRAPQPRHALTVGAAAPRAVCTSLGTWGAQNSHEREPHQMVFQHVSRATVIYRASDEQSVQVSGSSVSHSRLWDIVVVTPKNARLPSVTPRASSRSPRQPRTSTNSPVLGSSYTWDHTICGFFVTGLFHLIQIFRGAAIPRPADGGAVMRTGCAVFIWASADGRLGQFHLMMI